MPRLDAWTHTGTTPVRGPRTRPDATIRFVLWGVGGAHLGADYITPAEAREGAATLLAAAQAAEEGIPA